MTIEQALNTKFIYSQLFDTEEQAYSMGKMSTVVEQSRFWKHEEDPLRHLVHLRVSECFWSRFHLKSLHLLRFWAHQVFLQDFDLGKRTKENLHVRHGHTGGKMDVSVLEGLVQLVLQVVMFVQDEKLCFWLQYWKICYSFILDTRLTKYFDLNTLNCCSLYVSTCVVGQGKEFCHIPKLAKGTWVQKDNPKIQSDNHPPERLSYKALEKADIARPSFKAESHERSAIPDSVNVSNQ